MFNYAGQTLIFKRVKAEVNNVRHGNAIRHPPIGREFSGLRMLSIVSPVKIVKAVHIGTALVAVGSEESCGPRCIPTSLRWTLGKPTAIDERLKENCWASLIQVLTPHCTNHHAKQYPLQLITLRLSLGFPILPTACRVIQSLLREYKVRAVYLPLPSLRFRVPKHTRSI